MKRREEYQMPLGMRAVIAASVVLGAMVWGLRAAEMLEEYMLRRQHRPRKFQGVANL